MPVSHWPPNFDTSENNQLAKNFSFFQKLTVCKMCGGPYILIKFAKLSPREKFV